MSTVNANSKFFVYNNFMFNSYDTVYYVAVNLDQPVRELFVWAVFFNLKPVTVMLWKQCPYPLGSALVARSMLKSLASEATAAKKPRLADELDANAGLVIYCCNL